MSYLSMMKLYVKVPERKCEECGAFTQGWKGPDGRTLCPDCYFKIWGERPKG